MRRRARHNGLGWALLLSLLINHTAVLPVVYYLLFDPQRELPPEVVEVELLPDEQEPPPPEPEVRPPVVDRMRAPRRRAPQKPPAPPRKLEPEPVARKETPPPPEEKKPPQQQPRPPLEKLRLKMVEVNNPETDRAPDDARFLSDKNRRVERETRARETNLVKDHPRPRPVSRPTPEPAPNKGSAEPKIAEERRQQAPREAAQPRQVSPLMSMRAPPAPRAREAQPEVRPLAAPAEEGSLPAPSKQVTARQLLTMDHHSHDRIFGEQARKERELARLSPSVPRGGKHERWEQIKSALENFVPEVQPGNQTALGTRADPFALYIARMHRKIHKLWGFGFLSDLDVKPDSNAMNDMSLWTVIEVVIKPDGAVKKATIVRPSGVLTYDVAALSVVFTAAPYPSSPRAIRSTDGNMYLHWRFHRDQRQCGTFGVDPFILTKPPEGPIDSTFEEVGKTGAAPDSRQRRRRLSRIGGGPPAESASGGGENAPSGASQTSRSRGAGSRSPGASRGEAAPPVRPEDARDPAAEEAARRFVEGLQRGDAARMLTSSALPFSSRGQVVARSQDELKRMLRDLVAELPRGEGAPVHLMTVMEARKLLGALPPGADYGAPMLVGRTRLGEEVLTFLMRRGADGRWRVVSLDR